MKMHKLIKGLSVLTMGCVFPIPALVEPDGSKYRCTLKGIKQIGTMDVERWKDVLIDFVEWCKA